MGNHFHFGHGDAARQPGCRDERRREAEPEEWKAVRRGWYYRAAELKERLLEQMAGEAGVHHGEEEVRESAEQKAERIVREELKKRGGGGGVREEKQDRWAKGGDSPAVAAGDGDDSGVDWPTLADGQPTYGGQ